MSIIGTPKASVMAIRSGMLMASAIEVTERRFSFRRPSRCSAASEISGISGISAWRGLRAARRRHPGLSSAARS